MFLEAMHLLRIVSLLHLVPCCAVLCCAVVLCCLSPAPDIAQGQPFKGWNPSWNPSKLESLNREDCHRRDLLAAMMGIGTQQECDTPRHIQLQQRQRRNARAMSAQPQKKQAPCTAGVHRHLGVRWGRGDR
jgi:hypothetical protein